VNSLVLDMYQARGASGMCVDAFFLSISKNVFTIFVEAEQQRPSE